MMEMQMKFAAPEQGTLLVETRGWALFALGASNDWINLKLIAKTIQPKRNFWLAWNGKRLARNHDGASLNTYHPDVYDWLVTYLEEEQQP